MATMTATSSSAATRAGASGAVATSGEKLRGDREKGERLTVRLTRRPVTALELQRSTETEKIAGAREERGRLDPRPAVLLELDGEA